jgi:energy-coupling factor transporter transmembrane protein EcfT
MSARASAILETQQSRGLETRGLLRRALALPALVGPLVIGALVDVEERAMTLESRAYNRIGPKTSLRQLVDTGRQQLARWVILVLIVVLIAWRIARVFQF